MEGGKATGIGKLSARTCYRVRFDAYLSLPTCNVRHASEYACNKIKCLEILLGRSVPLPQTFVETPLL
jgi:hypothetical protein